MKDKPRTVELLIPGPPLLKKRAYKIIVMGRRYTLGLRTSYKTAAAEAEKGLLLQVADKEPPFVGPVHVEAHFYALYHEDDKNGPDLVNLEQAPADHLQAVGLVANDRQVRNWDGSRVHYLCDGCDEKRPGCRFNYVPALTRKGNLRFHKTGLKKGQVKKKRVVVCSKARTELTVTPFVA